MAGAVSLHADLSTIHYLSATKADDGKTGADAAVAQMRNLKQPAAPIPCSRSTATARKSNEHNRVTTKHAPFLCPLNSINHACYD
jgi:hypothetical protein